MWTAVTSIHRTINWEPQLFSIDLPITKFDVFLCLLDI